MKVLITDDDADSRELVRLTLSMHGIQVVEAEGGAECLKLAREFARDLPGARGRGAASPGGRRHRRRGRRSVAALRHQGPPRGPARSATLATSSAGAAGLGTCRSKPAASALPRSSGPA
jgi:CheY-like chemotaxis protein